MKIPQLFVIVPLLTFGCGADGAHMESQWGGLDYGEDASSKNNPVEPSSIPSTGPVPPGCVRIEGGEVGQEGIVIDLEGRSVTVTGWSHKDDGPGEEIGFTYVASGGQVSYAVKAGGETHYGNASPWKHPGGTGGPEAPGISNITFCPGEPDDGDAGSGGTSGSGGSYPGGSEGWDNGEGGGSEDLPPIR